eukprot:TRINITY_DN697_c0_g1_i3.p2 TRINITY_DN697_c0_g1~~TRINITY_DN697_c0_g1_i3.p2  ORF type:complete len:252 (+),score=41.95 TRINITY_DN697_c0_g1_i3:77-757(+)
MPSQLSAEQPQQQPRHAVENPWAYPVRVDHRAPGLPPRCPETPLEECPRAVSCRVVYAENGTRKYRFQYSRPGSTRSRPAAGPPHSVAVCDPLTPICGSPGRAMLRVTTRSGSCDTPRREGQTTSSSTSSERSLTPGPLTSGARATFPSPGLFEPEPQHVSSDNEAGAAPERRGEVDDPLQWSVFTIDKVPEAWPLQIYPTPPPQGAERAGDVAGRAPPRPRRARD